MILFGSHERYLCVGYHTRQENDAVDGIDNMLKGLSSLRGINRLLSDVAGAVYALPKVLELVALKILGQRDA